MGEDRKTTGIRKRIVPKGQVQMELDLGGGFGICYTEKDAALRYDSYMEKVSVVVKEACERLHSLKHYRKN